MTVVDKGVPAPHEGGGGRLAHRLALIITGGGGEGRERTGAGG